MNRTKALLYIAINPRVKRETIATMGGISQSNIIFKSTNMTHKVNIYTVYIEGNSIKTAA